MAYKIIRNDIAQVHADVIVNSANPRPICGGSTEAVIYDAAGYDELLEARQMIGHLAVGQLGVTSAFRLSAKKIIHVSCPWWNDDNPEESQEILASCYAAVIEKARQLGAKSIAFPLLSSGVYRFPKAIALEVAIGVFGMYEQQDLEIILVVYDDETFAVASELYPEIEDGCCELKFYSESICREEIPLAPSSISGSLTMQDVLPKALEGFATIRSKSKAPAPSKLLLEDEIGEIIKVMDDDTFQDKLMGYIEKKGMNPAMVYRAANLDRKLFSKVKKDGYIPGKNTVLALAVGLRLNLEETMDLLSRAHHAFSPSSKRDAIIKYFIQRDDTYKKGTYRPIDVINDYLTCFREDPLGES